MAGDEENDPAKDVLRKKVRIREGHRQYVQQLLAQIEDGKDNQAASKVTRTQLKEKLRKLEILDEEILELVGEVETDDATACVREIGIASEFKGRILAGLTRLDDILSQKPPPQVPEGRPLMERNGSFESLSSTATSMTRRVRTKLPKLEIKKLSGKAYDWQEFWDSFKSSVDENEELSTVDKFAYLRHLLEEPARAVIAGYSLTERNYEDALNLLKERFAKPTVIKQAHLNELANLRPVFNARDMTRLKGFYDQTEANFRGLEALGVDMASYSCIVVPILMEKLPANFRLSMIRATEKRSEWDMAEFVNVFRKELEIREMHTPIFRSFGSGDGKSDGASRPTTSNAGGWKQSNPGNQTKTATALHSETREHKCAFCLGTHKETACEKVTDTEERKNLVKKFGRCFVCLIKGHRAFKCRSWVLCLKCNGKHHVSLCDKDKSSSVSASKDPKPTAPPVESVNAHSCIENVGCGGRVALQTAQGVLKGRKNVQVRVLFDSGSSKSFATSNVVQMAELTPFKQELLSLRTFGSKEPEVSKRDVMELTLMPKGGGCSIKFDALVVDSISEITNQHLEIVKNNYEHLKDIWFADVTPNEESLQIHVLVGSDFLWRFQDEETRRGRQDEPVAVKTKLGWVLSGPIKGERLDITSDTTVNCTLNATCNLSVAEKVKLDNDVHKLWDLDSIGIREQDEAHTDTIDSIEFDGERYSTKLPWKIGHKPLPDNYSIAVSRLKSQLSRLKKEPEVLEEYDRIINEQLRLGIIEKVLDLESTEAEKLHYLPHQPVIRRDAETTKVRIVFDASCKERSNGTSLNDCLHTGPSLTPLLFDLLIRFREQKVALVADIEKAFLNVGIHPCDRDSLRFLWVDSINTENPSLVTLRYQRVVFGVRSSPFLLNAVIRHHLEGYKETDPRFANKVSREFYVDDLASGAEDVSSALDLYHKVKYRMQEGGFHLRKWKTNSTELVEKIEKEEKMTEASTSNDHEVDQSFAKSTLGDTCKGNLKSKVLGITWDQENDNFEFDLTKMTEIESYRKVTKREILSSLAKLFGPLGIVSPISVTAKILFQELCLTKLGWDEELSEEQRVKRDLWIKELQEVGTITIPMCLYEDQKGEIVKRSLHGFCDASQKGYCAVIYLVCETQNGTFSRLICSKTRVAPLKPLTIPRLELMSARILAVLMNTVCNALSPQMKIDEMYYWSDSKTALYWIQNRNEWKQFVQHRVNEILTLSSKEK